MIFEMKGALGRLKKTLTQSDLNGTSSSTSLAGSNGTPESEFDSIFNDDELPPVTLHGYSPTTKNRLLSTDMCDEIRKLMPSRIQLYSDWHLLYNLEQHGASLHSLYDRTAPESQSPMRVGYVIIIRDKNNGIFGAYSNEHFHPTEARRYFGNGECFLWKMDKTMDINLSKTKNEGEEKHREYVRQFKGFPYTGLNEFAIYCTSKFLSMGAGDGHYGLWCDDSLLKGVSDPCQTFGNEPLSNEGNKFHIMGLEVWRVG